MSLYRVIAPHGVTFRPPAVLSSLSAQQLRHRGRQLRETGEASGVFKVVTEASFKYGEELGVDSPLTGDLKIGLADLETGLTHQQQRGAAMKAKTEAQKTAGRKKAAT